MRIILDAMGGDFAPGNEVQGAIAALRTSSEFELILVGDETAIRAELKKHGGESLPVQIVHASQVITMEDSPTAALKQKKDSSLAVGMRMHQEGKAEAFVSTGNTGAMLSASTLILGRVKGVSRPTIGAFLPSAEHPVLLVDAGTNVDCRAQHLYEFAVMGSIHFSKRFNVERPKVALLNVGEEKSKGTEVVLEAYKMLSESSLNFIGNVEGRDILKTKADVVVCDGFVGNIVLKFGESVPGFLKSRLSAAAKTSVLNAIRILFSKSALKAALSDLDPNKAGGVPVLGVNGVSIIGHGSSSPEGIKNMILRAAEVVKVDLNKNIERALAESAPRATEG